MTDRLRVRLSPVYQGWTMKCPHCDIVCVRDTWPDIMVETGRHLLIHQHRFAIGALR